MLLLPSLTTSVANGNVPTEIAGLALAPGKSIYVRVLFVLARYPALASAIIALIPVRFTALIWL